MMYLIETSEKYMALIREVSCQLSDLIGASLMYTSRNHCVGRQTLVKVHAPTVTYLTFLL